MRKPLQTGAMLMALALGGNAAAHPDIASCCFRESDSGESWQSHAASVSRPMATGDDRSVAVPDVSLPEDSFRPIERVAPGRLDKSVSYVSTVREGVTKSNVDDGRPALHPSTPDTAATLPATMGAPRVVLDGTAMLTGSWLSSGQYVLTFVLRPELTPGD